MSSQHIYHYLKEQPEYNPNKFDIVGGLDAVVSPKLGSYDGVDYLEDESQLDNILEPEKVTVIGGRCVSASTVDIKLSKFFKSLPGCKPIISARRKSQNMSENIPSREAPQRASKKSEGQWKYGSAESFDTSSAGSDADGVEEWTTECPAECSDDSWDTSCAVGGAYEDNSTNIENIPNNTEISDNDTTDITKFLL